MTIMNEKCWKILRTILIAFGIYLFMFLIVQLLSTMQGNQYLKSDSQLSIEYNKWLDSALTNPDKIKSSTKYHDMLFIDNTFIDYASEDLLLGKMFLFSKWHLTLKDGRRRMIPMWSTLHKKTERLMDTLKVINFKLEEHIE